MLLLSESAAKVMARFTPNEFWLVKKCWSFFKLLSAAVFWATSLSARLILLRLRPRDVLTLAERSNISWQEESWSKLSLLSSVCEVILIKPVVLVSRWLVKFTADIRLPIIVDWQTYLFLLKLWALISLLVAVLRVLDSAKTTDCEASLSSFQNLVFLTWPTFWSACSKNESLVLSPSFLDRVPGYNCYFLLGSNFAVVWFKILGIEGHCFFFYSSGCVWE